MSEINGFTIVGIATLLAFAILAIGLSVDTVLWIVRHYRRK